LILGIIGVNNSVQQKYFRIFLLELNLKISLMHEIKALLKIHCFPLSTAGHLGIFSELK